MEQEQHFPAIILNDIKSANILCFIRKINQLFSDYNIQDKVLFSNPNNSHNLQNAFKGLGFIEKYISGKTAHRHNISIGATACVHLSSAQLILQKRVA